MLKLSNIILNSNGIPLKECVGPQTTFLSMAEISDYIEKTAWSPYQFKGKFRRNSDMLVSTMFAIDIDEGLTIEEAIIIIKDTLKVDAIIAPTRNHKLEKNGVVCDRFRILFKLSRPITRDEIAPLFNYLLTHFPSMDPACKDAARFYYPSLKGKSIIIDEFKRGIEVPDTTTAAAVNVFNNTYDRQALRVQYGKLRLRSTSYDYFKNGAPNGLRHKATVSAAYDAKQQLWTKEEFISMLDILKFPWMNDDNNRKRITDVFDNPDRECGPPRLPPALQQGADRTALVPDVNALALIQQWLTLNEYNVSYDRTILGSNKEELGINILKDKLVIDLAKRNISIKQSLIDSVINMWINETRLEYKNLIRDELCPTDITFNNEYSYKGLRDFLNVYSSDVSDLDVKVLAHQLWHIKRKLCGEYNNINPLMFVMSGKEQGTGKSWGLAKYLLSPLKDLLLPQASFKILTDERESALLSDSFAIIFDEMSHADRSSMEAVKSVITGTNLKQRVMKETYHTRLKINSTQFATCQDNIKSIIKDDTGMRRYYQFTVNRSRKETSKRWTTLGDINYVNIFRYLDHIAPSPINNCLDALYDAQEHLRHKKPVEEWLHDVGYTVDKGANTLASELLNAFNDWYTSNKYNPSSFGREMGQLGFNKKRSSKGNVYNITINNKIGGFYDY